MNRRAAIADYTSRTAAFGSPFAQDIVVLDVIRLLGLIRPGRGLSF